VGFVHAILELDRKAPRKQRHTAHRIWERIWPGKSKLLGLEHYLDVLNVHQRDLKRRSDICQPELRAPFLFRKKTPKIRTSIDYEPPRAPANPNAVREL
jgi:hypothetical protein